MMNRKPEELTPRTLASLHSEGKISREEMIDLMIGYLSQYGTRGTFPTEETGGYFGYIPGDWDEVVVLKAQGFLTEEEFDRVLSIAQA